MEEEANDKKNQSVVIIESSFDSSIEEITEGVENKETGKPTVPVILSSSEMAIGDEVESNDLSSDRIDADNEKPVTKSGSSGETVVSDEVESSESTSGRIFKGDEPGECSSVSKNPDTDEMFVIDNIGSTDSTSKNVEPETSEKDDSGIYPASPVTEDEVSTSSTGEDNKPMKIKKTPSVKEVHGVFPANPFADEDSILMLDSEEGNKSLKTTDKLRLKRLNKPEIISSEEISSSDASASREGDKDRQSDMTSMKDGFFLDVDGEIVTEEGNKSADVIYIEGVSIDTDGDNVASNFDDRVTPYPVHEIPRYNSSVAGVLSDIEYSMDTGKKIQDAKPKKTCFNCLGDHNFQECPEPSDPQRIAANRKKQKSSRISSVRYHEDCDNKYGQYQPGRISENLREALGLRYGDLPIHIYRMRYLGYPPGWLKEAEVRQGEMKLYDGSGKSVVHPDAEEGEVESSHVKYNPDKLISYPGFNVEIPKGYHDDWKDLNFPPMQRYHRKSEFRRFMELNKAGAYKKRKLTLKSHDDTTVSSIEMDIDDSGVNSSADLEFNPPLPDEPLPPLPPDESPASPDPPPPEEEGEIIEEDSQSSMSYLEAKRKSLLEQLGDSRNPVADSSLKSPPVEKDNVSSSDTENDTESSVQLNEDSENSRSSINNHKKPKVKHHRSQSKGFQLGAAIPPSITPYGTLPDADKWTVDVSDHINFENLPDALGTWVKMKGLVGKVRNRMCEIHADDDE